MPAKHLLRDEGEDVALLEPMLISEENESRSELSEMVHTLTKRSVALRTSLPSTLVRPLADFVRSMNCYYSNLIEGHNTHPIDIERALNDDFSLDEKKRDLQREAKAHVEVQRWIDAGGLAGNEGTVAAVLETHRRFTSQLPADMREVENPDTGEKVVVEAGVLRQRDARVGQHVAVSPGALPRFMQRYEERYAPLKDFELVLNAAASHHRLLYIHPFLDGNGRVTRLISYAMLLRSLESGGLWSVARGLARKQTEYKSHLANCDSVRQGQRDGRGARSEKALVEFTRFFLNVCIDQVDFMSDLMRPIELHARFRAWSEDEVRNGNIPERSFKVLNVIIRDGSVPRAEVADIVGRGARSATAITSALAKTGIITSAGPRDDWELAFPTKYASRLMPGLFPD